MGFLCAMAALTQSPVPCLLAEDNMECSQGRQELLILHLVNKQYFVLGSKLGSKQEDLGETVCLTAYRSDKMCLQPLLALNLRKQGRSFPDPCNSLKFGNMRFIFLVLPTVILTCIGKKSSTALKKWPVSLFVGPHLPIAVSSTSK